VLSVIYSLIVTMLLQPILGQALKTEITIAPLWIATALILLIPGVLEYLKLPGTGFRKLFMAPGVFSESFWKARGGSFTPLYLRHELRRGPTWLVIVLTVALQGLLPPGKWALWVLIAQLPIQRALFSVHGWRGLAAAHAPREGGQKLLAAIQVSQLIQLLITWFSLGACGIIAGFLTTEHWLLLGPAALGAVLAASSVALEGDSGRPWMVNFFSLGAGIIGGFLCLWSPWFLLGVLYFVNSAKNLSANRILSVEHLDEDHILP
jgi:hypothetical protein